MIGVLIAGSQKRDLGTGTIRADSIAILLM